MADWKIAKLRKCCHACEREFEPEEIVVSVVSLDANEEKPVRVDTCKGCFGSSEAAQFYWETRWVPASEKKRKVDFDRLRQLFEHWLEHPPQGQEALIYLIALLLVRRRFYRMLDLVSEEEATYLRLRRPGPKQQSFLCPAPLLSSRDLPRLRAELEQLLDGEFEDGEVEESATA